MRVHYKKKTSNYSTWEQKEHAGDYLLYPEIVLENWLKRASKFEENVFKTVINTIENNWEAILNFFQQ